AIKDRHIDSGSRSWRDGMVSGNGETGYVTSGEPYSDAFIFQHMYFNYPSSQPREIPAELTGQLEDARLNVFNLNDKWEIKDANGKKRGRTFYYSYHPGHQLRLTSDYTDTAKNYIRWTDYETAENGVKFSDKYGEWIRTSFTSRTDGVSVTRLTKSSQGQLINMTVSIDDIDDMCKAWDGLSKVTEQRYKKIVPEDCSYIAQIAHYPSYNGSELYDGGYGGVTLILAEGENAVKTRVVSSSDDPMLISDNASVEIKNAEAVYLITAVDRSFNMTGSTSDVMTKFASMDSYGLLDALEEKTRSAAEKYTVDGKFSYDNALAPSAKLQKAEFNRVSFGLEGDEEFADYDNNALISEQRKNTSRINHEFMRRAYEQARYAMICCGGTSAPRLYGMWTGEWNPGWRGIYTLDANVNLQVSSMNTSNLGGDFQYGYITFFLRHAPDYMYNASMAYGMHDALQPSVNSDADRAMHVEYDNAYPFEYWNAGASWCLLPIYEYWQCYGNQQIPINDYMRFDNLQKVLGVNDGGLTDEEFAAIKERGYLDLENDILLPLLTKQANFWEQIVTPRYYTDVNGNACHDESKTTLNEGEKYIIIPAYSPENNPIGYSSTITANATMDISAARDGLDMVCAIEKAVGREGYEAAVEKWQTLKEKIADYKFDSDGALKEWAMSEYKENNNHRHLSHLYPAWPAYETQNDPELAKAANIALDNRNKYNTSDATAGHGWMHKALVEARLKRGDGMMQSLLKMMNNMAYYSSMMTDHDTNRRNDTYCTDTAFGTIGAINEALAYSNTGEIEIIPALPRDWTKGSVNGLMARTRVEISNLTWDFDNSYAKAELTSLSDNNLIRLSCGETWTKASANGKPLEIKEDKNGSFVEVTLNKNEPVSVEFTIKVDIPQELIPTVTASDGNPGYAVDKDINTVYTVENQTSATYKNQFILFELNGEDAINKIVIKKAILAGEKNYWADWCLSVGCDLQGSFDGESWETIAEMNSWPDGMDNISEDVFEIAEPKAYKYVRYIRTKLKTSSDYAGWKWSDYGNRLSIAEIEFYTNKPMPEPEVTPTPGPEAEPWIEAEITSVSADSISVRAQSNTSGEYKMITAVYDESGALLSAKIQQTEFEKDIPKEITVAIEVSGNTAVFFWKDEMTPVSEKTGL
ncbi:MAG: glycoside hydrolase N-terminal domain-containing protein, partial [Oscillospiraceae bacterium]|nr:glycoside hydrolase N-terminal domain-containing protein [Oscillospiraceae bacterium]